VLELGISGPARPRETGLQAVRLQQIGRRFSTLLLPIPDDQVSGPPTTLCAAVAPVQSPADAMLAKNQSVWAKPLSTELDALLSVCKTDLPGQSQKAGCVRLAVSSCDFRMPGGGNGVKGNGTPSRVASAGTQQRPGCGKSRAMKQSNLSSQGRICHTPGPAGSRTRPRCQFRCGQQRQARRR